MKKQSYLRWQLRIFVLCWIAYACIYLGRNNLSVALPEIQSFLQVSKSQIGMIGGIFLWIYGIGQLINGYVGDKVSSRLYIFIGLLFTALSNILFGLTASLAVMCILWAANGFFQSMLWGPMAKTITHWVPPEKRSFSAIAISTSMVGGTLLAYLLAAQILSGLHWKWVFIVPGILILVYSAVWVTFVRNHPKNAGFTEQSLLVGNKSMDGNSSNTSAEEDSKPGRSYSLWEVIRKTRLQYIILACFAQGIIKDGINLWAPTFFLETHQVNLKAIASLILIIPVLNFGGMMLAGWLNRKLQYREKITTIILFLIGIVMILCLKTFGGSSLILGIAFLGLSSAMMYGANTLLLGVIPMSFAKYNKVSSVAGVLDFCSYMASGSAAAVTGLIIDIAGWGGVLIFWVCVTVIGTAALVASQYYESRAAKSPKTGIAL